VNSVKGREYFCVKWGRKMKDMNKNQGREWGQSKVLPRAIKVDVEWACLSVE
jgi:hypothetical protein